MSMLPRTTARVVLLIVCLAAPAARADLITAYFVGTVTRAITDVDFLGPNPLIHLAVGDPIVGAFRLDDRPGAPSSLAIRTPGLARGAPVPVAASLLPSSPGSLWITYGPGNPEGGLRLGPGGGGSFSYSEYTGTVLYDLQASISRVDYDPLTAPEPPTWGLALSGLAVLLGGGLVTGRARRRAA